jgi:hypothetical protein
MIASCEGVTMPSGESVWSSAFRRSLGEQSRLKAELRTTEALSRPCEVILVQQPPGTMEVSDESLARKARAGDLSALDALVRRWQVPLVRFLERRVGRRADAEDLFQETFIRVQQHLADYDDRRSFKTWPSLLWLYYVEQVEPREIARITGRSWVAIKTALHRARKALEPHVRTIERTV